MDAPVIGKVFLVGAGPGDPELLTIKGKGCLQAADAVLYDELVNRAILKFAPSEAELIYVGKLPNKHCSDQREIEARMILLARQGKTVVRLKGGDPFVFGRGGEEAMALRQAGIRFEIVPGISSAIAVPAYAGIPVTHRSVASSFAVVTGHCIAGEGIRWSRLAGSVDTLIILMGLQRLDTIMSELTAGGCEPGKPAALIQAGTSEVQRILTGTVATIGALARQANFLSPSLIVIGEVVRLSMKLAWFAAEVGRESPSGVVRESPIHSTSCGC